MNESLPDFIQCGTTSQALPTKSVRPTITQRFREFFHRCSFILKHSETGNLICQKTTKYSMSHTSPSLQNTDGLRFKFRSRAQQMNLFQGRFYFKTTSFGLDDALSSVCLSFPLSHCLSPPCLRPSNVWEQLRCGKR